ncbi:MAG: DUF1801 domain-containing protein [Nitrospirae bacterium]|nr:DUF1801 domain-containing protein [Nitrospirota bacterium]
MSRRPKVTSIDDYLATVSPNVRDIMEEIRKIVKRTVPAAEETISYQMPAFKLGRTFIYFAAFRKHVGIFPPVKGDKILANALLPYRGEKGNLKFPLNRPMPYELIGRVAVTLAQEYE